MKEWWNSISLRDKRILSLGFLFIICIVSYEFLWLPLVTENQLLRQQLQNNKELIIWMRTVNEKIHSLEKKTTVHSAGHSSLSIVQSELEKTKLIEHITELKQAENDSVQLHFQAISFDKLMEWLIHLYQEQGLAVSRIEVTSNNAGIINGQMVLKSTH